MSRTKLAFCCTTLFSLLGVGCQTQAQNGALVGAGAGGILGAIVGHQLHNTAAGAAIGAGAGALTGAAVGNKMDENDAKNRALIEQRLGHPIGAGGVGVEDVVAMTRAGVPEDVIMSHINANGIQRPLQTQDVIYLSQSGVSPRVVQMMQNPIRPPQTVVVQQAPPPVVVEEGYYGPRYYHPYYYRQPPPPSIGVGVAFR